MSADQPAPGVFGLGPTDRDAGTVIQRSLPVFLDERGEFPVGAMAVLFDHALGARVGSMLAADERMVTSHMHLEVIRSVPLGVEHVVGRNTDTTMVPGSAFCAAEASAPDGGLLVRASGRYAIIAGGGEAGGLVQSRTAIVQPRDDGAGSQVEAVTPVDSPVQQLFGLRVVERGDSVMRFAAIGRPDYANERGGIHGGVGAFICERAADFVLRCEVGADHRFRPVEMRVYFARPLPADDRPLDVTSKIGFLGRTTASTTTSLLRSDGRLAVQVDVTHLVRAS